MAANFKQPRWVLKLCDVQQACYEETILKNYVYNFGTTITDGWYTNATTTYTVGAFGTTLTVDTIIDAAATIATHGGRV